MSAQEQRPDAPLWDVQRLVEIERAYFCSRNATFPSAAFSTCGGRASFRSSNSFSDCQFLTNRSGLERLRPGDEPFDVRAGIFFSMGSASGKESRFAAMDHLALSEKEDGTGNAAAAPVEDAKPAPRTN